MQTKGSNFYLKFFNEFLALYIEILCPRKGKGKGKINQESNNFLIFEPNITKSGSRITISITKRVMKIIFIRQTLFIGLERKI